jgi:cobalt-precorrin 5A hydrolase
MVAGIGCRTGVTAAEVDAALKAALREFKRSGASLLQIATPAVKGREAAIVAAARARGIPLVLVAQSDLEAADERTLSRSQRSKDALNVYSVAEASALAAAGSGSQLLGPRVLVGPVACALATEAV